MQIMKLLLLSNSTMPGEAYFTWPQPYVKQFLGTEVKNVLFIPFAGVTISFDRYTEMMQDVMGGLGYSITSVHAQSDMVKAVENAEAIAVGGGNSFQLLKLIQENGLIDPIRNRVESGAPYVGWSAGSNVACPTIRTTNDMPIVEPPSFDALNLVPFQINPHFTNKTIPNHGGESREQRLKEFLVANKEMEVMGIPEGTYIEVDSKGTFYQGKEPMMKMSYTEGSVELPGGSKL